MAVSRKMKIATLKKWADALRSGKYKQTDSVLRAGTSNMMCCLGVLCDVVEPSKWDVEGRYDGELDFPPDAVLRVAGLRVRRDISVVHKSKETANQFANLNDMENATYEEIADVVDWMRFDLEASR